MLGTLLKFFATNMNPMLAFASNLLPILAMSRTMNDPAVSNAGLLNTLKAIQFVQPIVAQIEAISNAGVTKMSGQDKLTLFQVTLQEAEAVMQATGAGSESLKQIMPLLNAAVAAVCAQMKVDNYASKGLTIGADGSVKANGTIVGSLSTGSANISTLSALQPQNQA